METYCVNSKKNASNQLSSVSKTTKNRLLPLLNVLLVVRKNRGSLKNKKKLVN